MNIKREILKLTTLAVLASTTVNAAPLETDAIYNSKWTQSRAQELAREAGVRIRLAGYKCDTISSIRLWFSAKGYTINCNQYRYKYEIEDKGGRWVVTLQ